ncbi:MAG: guanylate kinase [Deltaproteobacteria bacterium]|nr:guanylate kinase [Deltaproteobacteria bacterium]
MPGRIYVISGPSGVGKSTILDQVIKRVGGLGYSVSHTSRQPRENEVDGENYHFVSREEFLGMVDEGAFVEWARVYDDYYGTSFREVEEKLDKGLDLVMDLDTQGARNIKDRFHESVFIYILPPSLEELERRLRGRGTDEGGVIAKRLEKAIEEIKSCIWYDYIVFNRNVDDSIHQVESIITSERCRTSAQLHKVEKIFNIEISGKQ